MVHITVIPGKVYQFIDNMLIPYVWPFYSFDGHRKVRTKGG